LLALVVAVRLSGDLADDFAELGFEVPALPVRPASSPGGGL
jgi:hypothetical protein